MGLEGSLPHSLEPATCPYPEPDKSSPCPPPSHFLNIHLNISSHLSPCLPSGLLPSGFPTKTQYAPHLSSPLCHKCYMPRPSHSSQFDHPKNLCSGVQIIKLTITYYCSNLTSTSYIPP